MLGHHHFAHILRTFGLTLVLFTGKFDQSAVLSQGLAKDNSGDDSVHVRLVQAYHGARANSIEALNADVAANPKSVAALIARAQCYMRALDCGSAVKDYTRVLALDPTQVSACIGRGTAYLEMNQLKQAEDDFRLGLKIDPANVDCNLALARLHIFSNRGEEALKDYAAALKPGANTIVFGKRADLLIHLGRFDEAIKDATMLIKLDPSDSVGYRLRAKCYLAKHDYEKAIVDLSAAIKRKPNDMSFYKDRAKAYEFSGKHALAQQDIAHVDSLSKQVFDDAPFRLH